MSPVTVRYTRNEALAARCAPVVPDHLGRNRSLVNEHQVRRIERRLLGLELSARGGNIRTVLLGGVQSFF